MSPDRPCWDALACLLLGVASPLAGLACPAREAFLLVVSCFPGLILTSLICTLVLQNLLVPCTLTWDGASILIPCLCTVSATDPGFVAPTEAPGPVPSALPSIIGVGTNKCTCKVAEEAVLLRSSLLLH